MNTYFDRDGFVLKIKGLYDQHGGRKRGKGAAKWVADVFGVHPMTVNRWLRGEKLEKLAAVTYFKVVEYGEALASPEGDEAQENSGMALQNAGGPREIEFHLRRLFNLMRDERKVSGLPVEFATQYGAVVQLTEDTVRRMLFDCEKIIHEGRAAKEGKVLEIKDYRQEWQIAQQAVSLPQTAQAISKNPS